MTQDSGLLVVVADGAHARFVSPDGRGVLHTVASFDSPAAHKRASDLGSDQPGASFHSQSTAHHALTPRHDPHALAEAEFAGVVADEIDAAFARRGFERLLLVAPPPTLHAIRDKLGTGAAAAILGTLGKDLVKTPDHDLAPHLRQWLTPPERD